MTETMKAVEIRGAGAPDVLTLIEQDIPTPGASQVLVRVHFAGVNRPDVAQRQGIYPPPPGANPIPGLEIAGIVVACGAAVRDIVPGDRVAALVNGGGYAEYCLAEERCTFVVADDVPLNEVAALPETAFTVWYNIFMRTGLSEGQTLLIHGGTSGIGTTALSLAGLFGVRAIATAGSAEKCKACTDLGAELAINYRSEDFVEKVLDHTDGRGADVILDMVGGSYLSRNLAAAAVEGHIAQIAFLEGMTPEIDLMSLVRKRVTLTGSMLRSRSDEDKALIADSLREHVWPLVAARTLRPVLDQTFGLGEVAQAHARMESGTHIGKILLDLR